MKHYCESNDLLRSEPNLTRLDKKCNPKIIVDNERAVFDKYEYERLDTTRKVNIINKIKEVGLKIALE